MTLLRCLLRCLPMTAAAPLLLPGSAAGQDAAQPSQGAQQGASQGTPALDVSEALRALESGDFVAAKAAVDRLVIADRTAAATQLRVAGRPMEALAAADAALAVASIDRGERAALLMARGRAAFAAAASDPRRSPLYEEALTNFEEAARTGAGVAAAFRASRAARMIGDHEGALELARAGARWVEGKEGRAIGLNLDQGYSKTLAEAAFSSYLAARSGPAGEESALAALFDEARGALEMTIGLSPTDPWAYQELSNLYLWEGRSAESLRTLASGLAVRPASEALHTAHVKALGDYAEAAAREGGAEGAAPLPGALRRHHQLVRGLPSDPS